MKNLSVYTEYEYIYMVCYHKEIKHKKDRIMGIFFVVIVFVLVVWGIEKYRELFIYPSDIGKVDDVKDLTNELMNMPNKKARQKYLKDLSKKNKDK